MEGPSNSRFERTLALLLRPIARLMIANDLPLSRAVELMKRALVQEAQSDQAVTDSYISLKTGMHRKDVKRLRSGGTSGAADKRQATSIAAVLSHWTHDSAFRDSTGAARPLPRQGTEAEPGFDHLVRAAKLDLPPATVLAELQRQGIIEADNDGRLILLSDTYLPKTGDAMLQAFDATILDHLRVATDNLLGAEDDQKGFDRVLRYSHLSQTSLDTLEAASRDAALHYLDMMNALAHDLQTADDDSPEKSTGRFVTGVFIAPEPNHPKDDNDTGTK